ncbi:thymidine kinase 2-like isoform X2, partial [Leptotrombidium deliense]
MSIEGNIGCGKTTLLKLIVSESDVKTETYGEPIEQWKNVNGENLLHRVYCDPCRWCFTMQQYVMVT